MPHEIADDTQYPAVKYHTWATPTEVGVKAVAAARRAAATAVCMYMMIPLIHRRSKLVTATAKKRVIFLLAPIGGFLFDCFNNNQSILEILSQVAGCLKSVVTSHLIQI